MKRLFGLFKNKYFLATLIFAAYMLFFDKNDLFSQFQYYMQLHKLKQEKAFYQKETDEVNNELQELGSNHHMLEKYAREKYLMKRSDEDVYVIVKPQQQQ